MKKKKEEEEGGGRKRLETGREGGEDEDVKVGLKAEIG